jgi:MFS transporter, SP family, sugar:H+ symporter
MVIAAILFLTTALVSGAASGPIIFAIARFFAGAAVGAASVLSPAYISEVTPAHLRGRLSSVQQIMIVAGLFGAAASNLWLSNMAGSALDLLWGYPAWRWMFWAQAAPALLFLFSLTFAPESPRFLVAKGKVDEARSVLGRLFGNESADRITSEIKATLATDHKPSMMDLKDPATGKWRKIVWVGIGLATFQQLVGINVIFYYGNMLWQAVGFTEKQAFQTVAINDFVSIGAVVIALLLIDRIGRKPLLLIGSAGMALTLAIMAFCFHQGQIVNDKLILPDGYATIAFFAAISYAALFNFSWGPVMWVLLGEMFPNQMRGSALAVAGFAQWTSNFLITLSFPWALKNLGLTTAYSFFTICAFISIFFVALMVKETKGKRLEEMEG